MLERDASCSSSSPFFFHHHLGQSQVHTLQNLACLLAQNRIKTDYSMLTVFACACLLHPSGLSSFSVWETEFEGACFPHSLDFKTSIRKQYLTVCGLNAFLPNLPLTWSMRENPSMILSKWRLCFLAVFIMVSFMGIQIIWNSKQNSLMNKLPQVVISSITILNNLVVKKPFSASLQWSVWTCS